MEKKKIDVDSILAQILDPEIPVLSIVDLGMIRNVKVELDSVEVLLSPTYNGCPALDVIRSTIMMELKLAGFQHVEIKEQLSPPWTTDWITEEGKRKLKRYGISPPHSTSDKNIEVHCPICDSPETEMISFFGSTACKSQFRCKDCLEPFDYFKCH